MGAVAGESGGGGGATSDIPGEYSVSVDAFGVDVGVSSLAWPTPPPGGGGALTFGKGRGVCPQNLKPYP